MLFEYGDDSVLLYISENYSNSSWLFGSVWPLIVPLYCMCVFVYIYETYFKEH